MESSSAVPTDSSDSASPSASSAYAQERLVLLQKVAHLLTLANARFQSLTSSLDVMATRSEAVADVADVWRRALVQDGEGESKGGRDESLAEGREDE